MSTTPSGSRKRSWAAPLLVCFLVVLSAMRLTAADGDELFSGNVVPTLRIEIPPAGMRVLRNYDQEKGGPRPERVDVKATVRDGDKVYTNVAVHLKGSYSFEPVDDKPSLTLNFDKFEKGQTFRGLDKINLNNSVQDPTYLHEALAREIFNEAGVPAQRAGHAMVTLNGRALGLYVLIEGSNKRFIKRHFKAVDGNLYDGGSGGELGSNRMDVDSGANREDHTALKALLAATRERDPAERYAKLDQTLDVDRFLTFAALEVLLIHWDGYCMAPNNYHVFHNTETGKMVFMPHGMDQILGRHGALNMSLTPQWRGAVARALFSTAEGKRRYLERVEQVFTNHFQADQLNAKVDRLAQRIRPYAAPGVLDGMSFQLQTRAIKSRIGQRVSNVEALLTKQEKPVPFSEDGVMSLTGWRFRPGNQGESSGRTANSNGHEVLEIHANGTGASGSWRKTVVLPPGHYELTGMAKVADLPAGVPGTGIIFRVSGERSLEGMITKTEWSQARYEFITETAGSYELICEYRGTEGTGSLDLSSLKLKRRQ